MVWYVLLDQIVGNRVIASIAPAVVLLTILSPATLVEEIFFRGFLLNKFWQTMGFRRANLASSSLFALVHFPGWFALGQPMPLIATDTLGLLVIGTVLGWAMTRTDSLWTAYTLHALNNLLVVVVLGS